MASIHRGENKKAPTRERPGASAFSRLPKERFPAVQNPQAAFPLVIYNYVIIDSIFKQADMSIPLKNNAYIDAANLHKGILDLGWQLDYRRFRSWLREKYQVDRAYLFIGLIPNLFLDEVKSKIDSKKEKAPGTA